MTELLDQDLAARVLSRALANGGRFAEVFAERRGGMTMSIDESRIESVQSGAEEGAGVRVVDGATTYFAHVDGLEPAELERAADEAASALRAGRTEPTPLTARPVTPVPIAVAPEDVPAARKAELLRELDQRGRGIGDEIAQLTASYAEARRVVTIANSDGLFTGDDRTRTRIGVQTVARRGDKVETGAETLGAHRGFELLEEDPGLIAEQAAQKALTLLGARPAPSGSMPVVVGGGFGGVLFHEMTGHGLEIDHIHKGASVYVGKLGEQVAQPLLNAYDDGRLPERVGRGRDRRRGPADAENAGDRGRQARLLPLRPPRRRARRGRLDRQRPARELPPPAAAADDQHLHRARRVDPRGDDRGGQKRLLCSEFRRRPGRPGDRRLRLRRLRGLPDRGRQGDQPLHRGDADRQLPRRARGDRRGRRRLLHEDGDLRQGRPESPGRDRPRPRPSRPDDGGRDGNDAAHLPGSTSEGR